MPKPKIKQVGLCIFECAICSRSIYSPDFYVLLCGKCEKMFDGNLMIWDKQAKRVKAKEAAEVKLCKEGGYLRIRNKRRLKLWEKLLRWR